MLITTDYYHLNKQNHSKFIIVDKIHTCRSGWWVWGRESRYVHNNLYMYFSHYFHCPLHRLIQYWHHTQCQTHCLAQIWNTGPLFMITYSRWKRLSQKDATYKRTLKKRNIYRTYTEQTCTNSNTGHYMHDLSNYYVAQQWITPLPLPLTQNRLIKKTR